MSDRELRDIVGELARSVESHDRILKGDKDTEFPGIMKMLQENTELDKQFREDINKKFDTLIQEVGKVAAWKEGIQQAPGKLRNKILAAAGIMTAISVIVSYLKDMLQSFFEK